MAYTADAGVLALAAIFLNNKSAFSNKINNYRKY